MRVEPGQTNEVRNGHRSIVTFRLESQRYALPIEPVLRITEMVTVTPIPQVARSVEGVINVGGTAVPAVSLRRHLGLPEASLQLDTHIILTQSQGRTTGLIVDEVLDVLEIPSGQIASPSDILPQGLAGAPLLQGVVHTPEGIVLLLDLEHLFLPQQTSALSTVLQALPNSVPAEAPSDMGGEGTGPVPDETQVEAEWVQTDTAEGSA